MRPSRVHTTYRRGHLCRSIDDGKTWFYVDKGPSHPINFKTDRRPCKRCGCEPTPEGHDACMGEIPHAKAACCGHGAPEPWGKKHIIFKAGYGL